MKTETATEVSSHPRRIDSVLSQELGEETMLYWADGKTIHVLNRTAQVIWDLCDGKHTALDMESAIRAEFQLPDDSTDVLGDVRRTLETFASKGLLRAT